MLNKRMYRVPRVLAFVVVLICIYLFMPFNLIVIATPPFKTFSFMHDKSNDFYKLGS